jgi:hypothetical protein
VIVGLLNNLERTSKLRWPWRRCQVAEEAAVARVYRTAHGVGVVEVGRGRV